MISSHALYGNIPKNKNMDINGICHILNGADCVNLGIICDGKYILTEVVEKYHTHPNLPINTDKPISVYDVQIK